MIEATPMTSRDDRTARDMLLPYVFSVAEAAERMECSQTTIRRKLRGLSGFVALTRSGSMAPAVCIFREPTGETIEQ